MKTTNSQLAKLSILIASLACIGIGAQYVAAQVATLTATSTGTGVSVVAAVATSTTATSTPPAQTTGLETAPTSTLDLTVIAKLENMYKRTNGHYLQILPGNRLPSYETGTVADDLGQLIPTNVRVDIYQAPKGDGYQISYTDTNGVTFSLANGPEGAHRTYTIVPSANTTARSTASN